jgi:hypothetical protein
MSSSETLDEEFYDVPESEDVSSPRQPLFDRNQLEKFGHWLLEIPRDDVTALRETPEYADFLEAFEKLGLAHRRVMGTGYNHTNMSDQGSTNKPSSFSFLQHMAVDDVVLRVMEFLECVTLIQTSATCSRFWDLARKSAIQRTHQIGMERQLQNVFELLRAKEQVEGLSEGTTRSYVPVPMLGLPRRVVVTDAGDPEYNGVYCCTDFDGNGFVFTKPRGAPPVSSSLSVNPLTLEELEQPIGQLPPPRTYKTRADKVLRCFISKKFSNEVNFMKLRVVHDSLYPVVNF